MANIQKLFGLLALAMLGQLAVAHPPGPPGPPPPPPHITPAPVFTTAPCFTRTVTVPVTTHDPLCANLVKCVPIPDCIVEKKKYIYEPCADANCPVTPTVTVTSAVCPSCKSGCQTKIVPVTVTTGCPTSTPTPW